MTCNNKYQSYYGGDQSTIVKLDHVINEFIANYKVNTWFIPAMISGDILERCGYFNTIPNNLTKIGVFKREVLDDIATNGLHSYQNDSVFTNDNQYYLTPAACIHFYPILEELSLKHKPIINELITTTARVYRYEDDRFIKGQRLWDFTVKEIVAVGSVEYVQFFLSDMKNKLLAYAKTIVKEARLEQANDSFYPTKENMLKSRFQKQNNSKTELIVDIGNTPLAISSFNYHGYHFSKEFHFDSNSSIVTGCVGCGIDRWITVINNFLK